MEVNMNKLIEWFTTERGQGFCYGFVTGGFFTIGLLLLASRFV